VSETVWTWLLFFMGLIGASGMYFIGNKKWYGHLIVSLHSIPWFVYSLIFNKPGFLALWFLWQCVNCINMWKWRKNSAQ